MIDLTALIITYNEEPNIKRVLEKLQWIDKVIILDSGSSDNTLSIVEQFKNTEVHYRKFDSFAEQCNYGLNLITTSWTLSLDADYVLADALIAEMKQVLSNPDKDAYKAAFRFCVFGYPLRSDNTTPRPILFKTQSGIYENDGHAHRLKLQGSSGTFTNKILHDDRKELDRWFRNQEKYSLQESQKLIAKSNKDLRNIDKIRKLKWLAPFLVFFYCLFVKGLILDGWYGWHYTLQRTIVEMMFALRLIEEEKLKKNA